MTIKVDRTVYSDSCISKTVYSFSAKYCFNRSLNDGFECISVSAAGEGPVSETVEFEFLQRLNDYKLREIIEQETRDIRTILYAKAFADSNEDIENV